MNIICPICDLQCIAEEENYYKCYNVDKTKYQYHYSTNDYYENQYFWFPQYGLNIYNHKLKNLVEIYFSNGKENGFRYQFTTEQWKHLKFNPKKIDKLIDQIQLYKVYS